MPTAPDVVSSIFRKYEKQELSPEFIRDESNNICDILEITRYGDPGRTARMFAEQGYVAKVNGTCKYDPDAIPLNKKCEFEKYEYVYGYQNFENSKKRMEKRKIDDLFNQLKRLVDENPENQDYLNNILNPIKQPEHHNACPHTPTQIIYYGVPGCGKSNKIREDLKNLPEKNKVRVVFHPEYSNAEFIGQILPKVNGHVTYEFTPGPFTQIIKRAYLNPNEQFYLVIEEINRGNAAAIFGDTFQLLDRLKAGETDSLGNDPANAAVNTFTEGWSQYFVQNDDVNAYIRKATKLDDGSYQERNDGEPIEEIKIKEIHFNANTAIRLPPNLSILATMNTSDQNVFTLDNAFQRRFDMELVRNEFDLTKPAVNAQYEAEIDDTGIKWGQFWGWINAKITATLKGLSSTEDKRLGVWFVSNVGGIIDDKVFAEKVLKFLWDDVFKFKRPQIFADGIDTLEKLINSFEKPSEGKERFDVFKDKASLVAFVASPTL
ncbi:MAG: AAA family ATPase [Fibrobacter sp.]|uniref:AAA family ATPase n=1 Tax=Fibrobacter sp. TaxID=35828 RepID=UPI0025C18C7F|nr:AAA family ATPase [Fibrobacter sp.]MBQ9226983.1 AAA family ATPase [Fibrobacter sp.]